MPLTYQFELESNITPNVLLKKISAVTGVPFVNDALIKDDCLGFYIDAMIRTLDDSLLIERTFGFTSNVYLTFYCTTYREPELEKATGLMLKAVLYCLLNIEGDMAFIYAESPSIILQRLRGVVTINKKWLHDEGLVGMEIFDQLTPHYLVADLKNDDTGYS